MQCFRLDHMAHFFTNTLHMSPANTRDTLRVIEKLTTGRGVTHQKKPGQTFLGERAVVFTDDLEALRRDAVAWLPRELDASNGWALRHPIQKMTMYKEWALDPAGFVAPRPSSRKRPRVEERAIATVCAVPLTWKEATDAAVAGCAVVLAR